jgi:hypothetical protein
MQKLLCLLVAGGLCAAPLSGQSRIGVVAGLVSSNFSLSSNDAGAQQSRTGFAVGLSLAMPAGKTLEFVPEVLYAEKGTTAASGDTPIDIKLTYLEVPLLFRYTIPASGDVHPFILAGPEIALKLSCNLSASSGTASASESCDADPDNSPNLKSVDYGLMFGVGVSVQRVSVSVRYDLGLANVSDDGFGDTAKNTAFLFLVGVHF